MSGRLAVLLLIVATFYTEFPRSSAANWVKFPNAVTTITYPDTKSVTMRWEWSLSGNELVNQLEIKRYKHGNQDNTEKVVAAYYGVDKTKTTDVSYFTFNFEAGNSAGTNGYGELVIKEVTSQGTNKDGTTVDVMNANYTYKCELSIAKLQGSAPGAKETILVVYRKPSITTKPKTQSFKSNQEVTLTCTSAGHPQPTISWDIRKTSGQFSSSSGAELKISFRKEDAGVYNCTATNAAGSASAVAVLQYTGCTAGCSQDDQIAIEMTSLTYTNEYENSTSQKYKDLKYAIEQECLLLYTKTNKAVYSCVVLRFREGSVVADLKIIFPTGTSDPRQPIQNAISTGTFAGQSVRTSFVSPTVRPSITIDPERLYISSDRIVTLRCTISAGHPQPTISWDIRKTSGQISSSSGTELKISFSKEDAGVYNCTATNVAGSASAVSVLQYTGCTDGCTQDDQIAIEMTSLPYTNEYENSTSRKYRDLKYAIEQECLLLYTKTNTTVYSCEVLRFRKGSVVADLRITFPTGTIDPRQPLQDAISTGTFANQSVRTSFVSPTGGSGYFSDDQIAIEMTSLSFNNEYEDSGSQRYRKLKYAIEQECLLLYAKASKTVYSCEVLRFRNGSVIAVLMIKYPNGARDPRQPLQDAISTGTFANQSVRTSFVSPTTAPTQSTQPAKQSTVNSSSNSGQQATGEGGLPTCAIVAIAVFLSIAKTFSLDLGD